MDAIKNILPTGTVGYIIIFACVYLGYCVVNAVTSPSSKPVSSSSSSSPAGPNALGSNQQQQDEDEEVDPPRNFTQKQLLQFDGKQDEKSKEAKPVYLSVKGIVFDVTDGKDFYGPGGPYELFAGHECGVALAKMSFNTEYLDDLGACDDLNYGEKEELDNWLQKFEHWRNYPIKGKLIPDSNMPDADRILTKEDLWENKGDGEVPEGYAAAPIYLGAHDKVYDMSFGGVTFYGKGCSYNGFAGRDAARALATMSLNPADAMNSDISDLSEKQIGVLNDWKKTFEERKCYPIVGKLK